MRGYLLLLSIVLRITASAQGISGILTDEHGLPLSYVNVTLVRTQLGSNSTESGRYTIDTAGLQSGDEIAFTHLGYTDVRMTVSTLIQSGTSLSMRPRDYAMREVVVTPRDARGLLLDAISAIKDNYPNEFTREEMVFKDYSIRNGHKSHYGYYHFDLYAPTYTSFDSLRTYTTLRDYAV